MSAPVTPDPTPGEVGLSEADCEKLCFCGDVHDCQTEADSDRLEAACDEFRARVERILAARTAALRAEVEGLKRDLEFSRQTTTNVMEALAASGSETAAAEARAEEAERQAEDRANENATLVHQARAELAELRAKVERVRRALDDELVNLADDGARLSHSVVRRVEAALGGGSDGA